jgi:hypothetical protein
VNQRKKVIFSKSKKLNSQIFKTWFFKLPTLSLKNVTNFFWESYIHKFNFVPKFYVRNENMWNDGFLFDFLQKKTADAWVRRFVVYTGFLFSERIVFEFIVRIYLDNFIWNLHSKSLFESSNTSEMLTTTIFLI